MNGKAASFGAAIASSTVLPEKVMSKPRKGQHWAKEQVSVVVPDAPGALSAPWGRQRAFTARHGWSCSEIRGEVTAPR